MRLNDLLAELGSRLELGRITLDDEGTCCLTFDDTYVVGFERAETDGHFHMYSVIASVPMDAEATLRTLLVANLFGHGTGGATFSIDPEQDEILLTRTFREDDTTPDDLVSALEGFVHYTEHWMEVLGGFVGAEAEDRAEPETSGGRGSGRVRVRV